MEEEVGRTQVASPPAVPSGGTPRSRQNQRPGASSWVPAGEGTGLWQSSSGRWVLGPAHKNTTPCALRAACPHLYPGCGLSPPACAPMATCARSQPRSQAQTPHGCLHSAPRPPSAPCVCSPSSHAWLVVGSSPAGPSPGCIWKRSLQSTPRAAPWAALWGCRAGAVPERPLPPGPGRPIPVPSPTCFLAG